MLCLNVYLTLFSIQRYFNIKWIEINDFLKTVSGMNAQACNEYLVDLQNYNNTEELNDDGRGGKYVIIRYNICRHFLIADCIYKGKQELSFYEYFPDIQIEAKAFVTEQCTQKDAHFKAEDLMEFVNKRYLELHPNASVESTVLIRSLASCKRDLTDWGITCDKNGGQPYFEGHNRTDVVEDRESFIDYFTKRSDSYYQLSEDKEVQWIKPSSTKRSTILCAHDEVSFRSGEQSAYIYNVPGQTRFYNKGTEFVLNMKLTLFFKCSAYFCR